MKKTLCILLVIPFIAIGQIAPKNDLNKQAGIRFEFSLSWKEILAKAKAENKYIFMDCYATWCGPCKFMSNNIFPQKEVGDYMNANFISVAVQMDQTAKDPESIKRWYTDAKGITDKYSVSELPTYLFFSPDGHAVHRIIGTTGKEGADFITKAKEAMDPDKQYYTRMESYKNHLNDSAFLHDALTDALTATDRKNAEAIGDAYVNCLRNPYTIENLKLLSNVIQSSKNQGFKLFYNNFSKINEVVGDGMLSEYLVGNIIAREELDPLFLKANFPLEWKEILGNIKKKYPSLPKPIENVVYKNFEYDIFSIEIEKPIYKVGAPFAKWSEISERIKRRYPGYNPDSLIVKEKPRYFLRKKLWPECEQAVIAYMDKYGEQLGQSELNNMAWNYVFMHFNDKKTLGKALNWSKRSIPDSSDVAYMYSGTYTNMDTYANLLYKLGERDSAILWEKKAIQLASRFTWDTKSQINYRMTLEKMQNGGKTWEGRNSYDLFE